MAERKSAPTPPTGFDFDRTQAAAYLGLTKSALDAWALNGARKNLPYVRVGNRCWYRKSDCDALLRRWTHKPEAA